MMSAQALNIHTGTVVASSFNAGLVAAAFFASLTGCLLTVEILHRRGTALRNWRSWFETFACAISMGLVGIWCMHFIGNRAIVLGSGDESIQLLYNQGWTALSVFLPVLGLSAAFTAAEIHMHSVVLHRVAVGFSGVLAGLSVVGMHYVGNLGIANYTLRYSTRFFIASYVIAIGDCLMVLVLFYRWREQWISSWWKRLLCAVLLAAGVSAMHFTASTNCTYIFVQYRNDQNGTTRNAQVAIAGILCGTAALLLIGLMLFYRHRHQMLRRRSRKITLACALFDPDGRLLVTNEGALPCKEITDQYNLRSFEEEFDASHPVFQWIFRVTHNWSSVIDLVPGIKCHLKGCEENPSSGPIAASLQPLRISDPENCNDYSLAFREQFCVAAISLATEMQVPIRKLGVLYDQIIRTGILTADKAHAFHLVDHAIDSWPEMGADLEVMGKGQMLFVTRQVTREESSKLLNTGQGFRFAEFSQVRRLLSDFLGIPLMALDGHLERLTRYCWHLQSPGKAGTWLGFFALVPTPGRKCFDIAVQKGNTQQMPDVMLLPEKPNELEARILHGLNDSTVSSCLRELANMQLLTDDATTAEQSFALTLSRAVSELADMLPGTWARNARFLAKPLVAHYHGKSQAHTNQTTLYAFYVIIDMHSWSKQLELERIPLSFFSVRQRCYPSSPDHAVLARDIHQEFGPLLARQSSRTTHHCDDRRSRLISNTRSSMWTMGQASTVWSHESEDSDQPSVEMPRQPPETHTRPARDGETTWGGILVSSETVMKNDLKQDIAVASSGAVEPMGVNVAVGISKPEWTFVDELVAVTKARFIRRSI